jgi:protein-L-isoaspartate(D-aspartate) O-methyltransferase
MSLLARKVTTLERRSALVAEARARMGALRLMNVQAHLADGCEGWPEGAPFDRIIVNAAAYAVPPPLFAQLAEEGILLMPLGVRGDVRLKRFRKGAEAEDLGPIDFARLEEGVAED